MDVMFKGFFSGHHSLVYFITFFITWSNETAIFNSLTFNFSSILLILNTTSGIVGTSYVIDFVCSLLRVSACGILIPGIYLNV